MRRREFITLLGGAAAAWPLAARAQQTAVPVVGVLSSVSPGAFDDRTRAFNQGLAEAGYVEGKNVAIEYRWAEGKYERLPSLAADLVRRRVTVIAATGNTVSALAAKEATREIPIVFVTGGDAVDVGLVANLSRPVGNLTGVSTLNVELVPKRLELMHELLPAAKTIAVLVNPANPVTESLKGEVQAAAQTLQQQIMVMNASDEAEITTAFMTISDGQAAALVLGPDVFFSSQAQQLAALALRHRLPAIAGTRDFAAAGGLMSYVSVTAAGFRLAGNYVGRILKGEKPADLPVQQSTKVELIINLKTAKALGITVPITLLARADEVIE